MNLFFHWVYVGFWCIVKHTAAVCKMLRILSVLSRSWKVTRRNRGFPAIMCGDWLKRLAPLSQPIRGERKKWQTQLFSRALRWLLVFSWVLIGSFEYPCLLWLDEDKVACCLVEENCWETFFGYRVLRRNFFVFKVAFFRKMPHRPEHVNEQAWEPPCRVQLLDKTRGFGFEVKCFFFKKYLKMQR